jgi:hypothetical protein
MSSNKRASLKLPGAPSSEKKGPTAAEKLQLVGTNEVLKFITPDQLNMLFGKKPTYPVSLDLSGDHFQLENDQWLKGVPNVLKECVPVFLLPILSFVTFVFFRFVFLLQTPQRFFDPLLCSHFLDSISRETVFHNSRTLNI